MTFLVTPKREFLIMPVLALIVGFSIYVWPFRLGHAPIFLVSAVLFSMLTLAGRIFLPAYLAGVTVVNFAQWRLIKAFAIRLMSSDTNFFDAAMVAVNARQDIIGKLGGWWDAFYRPNIEPFLYAIPRAFWPSKPMNFVDISTALRAIENGRTVESTIGGNGVGIIGTSWVCGSATGLILGMLALGWAASFTDRFLGKMHNASSGRILIFAISATTLFQFYRQGTLGWVFLNFFQTVAVFWLTTLGLIAITYRSRMAHLTSNGAA